MAILKVAQLGHPVLRQKAEPVPKDMLGRPGLEKLVEDMVDTLREYEGLGLAAPQVHYPVQIIIVESRGDKAGQEEIPLTVLLNPQIVESSEEEVSN